MSLSKRLYLSLLLSIVLVLDCGMAWAQTSTYCNPMNLDYAYCPIPDFVTNGKHRATADPVIVLYRDSYYLFSTNQWGYWWSDDLLNWNFVARKFLKPEHKVYDELCAPAAFVMDDALYVIGSTYTTDFTLWRSRNPKTDDWEPAIENFPLVRGTLHSLLRMIACFCITAHQIHFHSMRKSSIKKRLNLRGDSRNYSHSIRKSMVGNVLEKLTTMSS